MPFYAQKVGFNPNNEASLHAYNTKVRDFAVKKHILKPLIKLGGFFIFDNHNTIIQNFI